MTTAVDAALNDVAEHTHFSISDDGTGIQAYLSGEITGDTGAVRTADLEKLCVEFVAYVGKDGRADVERLLATLEACAGKVREAIS